MSIEETASATGEISILKVLRELEERAAPPVPETTAKTAEIPQDVAQAQQLKASLERKREFVRLANGYTDMGDIPRKIDEALAELDAIINT